MDSLLRPPIAFAHRGARAHAPENTLDAFSLALRLGATGLESDVWLTADGVAVLAHDPTLRVGLRRRPIRDLRHRDLPPGLISLEELYEALGTAFELSLDVKDARAGEPVVALATGLDGAVSRLWLCHPEWERLAEWRELSPEVHLVDSTRLRRIREGPERRAATLARTGVDAINLHHSDWTGGLTTLFHRFERYAFAWDCQHPRIISAVLAMGVDAVYSDHVDRMVDALSHHAR